jgi:hypothetical protein
VVFFSALLGHLETGGGGVRSLLLTLNRCVNGHSAIEIGMAARAQVGDRPRRSLSAFASGQYARVERRGQVLLSHIFGADDRYVDAALVHEHAEQMERADDSDRQPSLTFPLFSCWYARANVGGCPRADS